MRYQIGDSKHGRGYTKLMERCRHDGIWRAPPEGAEQLLTCSALQRKLERWIDRRGELTLVKALGITGAAPSCAHKLIF